MIVAGRGWSKEEDNWLREHYPELGAKGCHEAQYLDRTYGAIGARACYLEVAMNDEACYCQRSEIMEKRWARGDFSSEEYRHKRSKAMKAAWARGDYDEECLRKRSKAMKVAWARGDFGDEEWSRKHSEAMRAAWERGDLGGKEWLDKMTEGVRAAWERGDYDGRNTEEWRRKQSEAKRVAWERGDYDGMFTEEYRRKISETTKARWECGDLGNEEHLAKLAEGVREAWGRGVYDGVFGSPTSIELEVAAALDALGVEHIPQYRPEGCRWPYDEFVPPNTLIEAQGDYWHSLPARQERDAEKAAWAGENGFELIAIWEYEIKEVGAWSLIAEKMGGIQNGAE